MSENSSSSINSTSMCNFTTPRSIIFSTFLITQTLLLLPLSILILYLGLQRWRQRRQTTTATATATSHSDVFTYNLVAMELVGVLGCVLILVGICNKHLIALHGKRLWSFNWYGENFFHVLTCLERYLAVVHPTTYLTLRGGRGVMVRNVGIGCVWLLCLLELSLMVFDSYSIITEFCFLVSSIAVISFCSVSVLCVLIRPGPGERGGDTQRVDPLKRRAFFTIVAIFVVLLIRFIWNLAWLPMYLLGTMEVLLQLEIWFNLPCSLVIPLLFLHRAGMLMCCKKTAD